MLTERYIGAWGEVLMNKKLSGFTIVELLIVIVVVAILAAISIVAYNGIQSRAKNVQIQADIKQIVKLIEAYNADTGAYPSTGSLSNVYSDNNCQLPADNSGYKGVNWVPGLTPTYVSALPQNPNLTGVGMNNGLGCYVYSSDGQNYILSAWRAKYGNAETSTMYRRLGFRENSNYENNSYYCNHQNIGGNATGTYNSASDYYKYSYTVSNITTCNETPPAGA